MSVYDRAMFRGSRSTGQPVKQATQVLSQKVGEKVMSDAMGGIASAKDPVELMNAMRGDQRTMKERRQELGGIVGMKDANKTPESVVTLVQPVLQMREAQGSVDQGIGQVAQKAMSSPVTDAVQKGIMQPLKMQKAGEVSLQRLYQQNLPLIQEIYGGDADAERKQALGQVLLGGLAPIGLQIAQGKPIAEALMPLGPYLAQQAATVKAAKDKRDMAAKAGALQMATSDRDRILSARAKASEPFNLSEGQTRFQTDPDTGVTKELARGPQKKEYTTVYKLDSKNPMGFVSQDILKSAETPEGFSRSKPDVGGYSVMVNRQTGELTKGSDLFFSQQPAGTFTEPQPNTLIDVFDAQGAKKKVTFDEYRNNISTYSLEDPTEKVNVYPLKDLTVGDTVIPAGTSVSLRKSFIDDQPEGTFSTEPPVDLMSKAKVLKKRDANGSIIHKVVFSTDDYEDLVNNQGFSPNVEAQFEYVPMFKMVDGKAVKKVATSVKEQNDFILDGFRPFTGEQYKVLGNQLLSISPAGTQVLYTQLESDPATLWDANNNSMVVNNKAEALAARQKGFHFTSKQEIKGITRNVANALLVDLADDIANGTASEEQIRQFQTSVSVVRDTPRVVTGEGGESMVTVGGTVPPFVIEAVRRAKELNPEFNDMGLLEVPVEDVTGEQDYEGIIDPTINYAESIGPQAKLGRIFGNAVDFAKGLFTSNYEPTNPDSFKGANDLHFLNVITVTRALNAVGGKDTEGLRARIESLQVDPYSAGLTKSKLLNSTNNMTAFLKDTLVKLEDNKLTAPSPQIKAKINNDIGEIEYLLDQYQLLQTNLQSQAGKLGSGGVKPQDAPSLSPN